MNTLNIIIATLLIYSLIAVIIYFIAREDDDIFVYFGMGIVGWLLLVVFQIIASIQRFCRFHNKRSIFEDKNTGQKYICNLKDTEDIRLWTNGYKLIKRYAPKSEWKGLPYFDKEFVEASKRNCDNCKYNEECCRHPLKEHVKCKHDEFGLALEFNKFEKK